MRHLALAALLTLLAACSAISLAPAIDNNARSYHQVVEDVTNSILVTNILRARDHAPLHYSDLTTINGSLQGTAAMQAAFPFGPVHPATGSNIFQLGTIGLQTSPSFTLGTLDTDDFTRGILTPVTPDVIKYFLDQGLDPRIAFLVFFEAVRGYGVELHDTGTPVDTHGKIDNAPDDVVEFKKFLAIANHEAQESPTQGFYANTYKELHPVGSPFPLDMKASYKDLAGFDFTKLRLVQVDNKGEYQLYSIGPVSKVVFCRRAIRLGGNTPNPSSAPAPEKYTVDGYRIFGLADTVLPADPRDYSEVCRKTEVVVGSGSSSIVPILYPRSPQGIIEYLGALLRFQDEHRRHGPITLSGDPRSGALFTLSTAPANDRFGVPYRGATYYVGKASAQDHTLEVLALLNQLFDLYKSAKDIPNIRPVTIIP